MLELYFPQDKSEYFPALISFVIFMIAAALTMRFIIAYSKKEEKKAEELERKILHDQKN